VDPKPGTRVLARVVRAAHFWRMKNNWCCLSLPHDKLENPKKVALEDPKVPSQQLTIADEPPLNSFSFSHSSHSVGLPSSGEPRGSATSTSIRTPPSSFRFPRSKNNLHMADASTVSNMEKYEEDMNPRIRELQRKIKQEEEYKELLSLAALYPALASHTAVLLHPAPGSFYISDPTPSSSSTAASSSTTISTSLLSTPDSSPISSPTSQPSSPPDSPTSNMSSNKRSSKPRSRTTKARRSKVYRSRIGRSLWSNAFQNFRSRSMKH